MTGSGFCCSGRVKLNEHETVGKYIARELNKSLDSFGALLKNLQKDSKERKSDKESKTFRRQHFRNQLEWKDLLVKQVMLKRCNYNSTHKKFNKLHTHFKIGKYFTHSGFEPAYQFFTFWLLPLFRGLGDNADYIIVLRIHLQHLLDQILDI